MSTLDGITFTQQLKEALTEIVQANSDTDNATTLQSILNESTASIPLNAITIAKSLAASDETLQKLNESLKSTQLIFTKTKKVEQTAVYAKRINKLKLKEQEREYNGLTKNINHKVEDDATLSSMMYAATVGANMIVAPISIGVLMYFFAGRLFSFMIPDYAPLPGKVNIPGMIAGVLGGVSMLFIEMILFVIRNHEMDRFVTKKKKKGKNKNPFGYDAKSAERTFEG